MDRHCISCGMPLRTRQEHAAGDPSKDYCIHCARPDGSMKSRDEVLEGMTAFLVRTQGFDQAAAKQAAASMMAGLPAWKNK